MDKNRAKIWVCGFLIGALLPSMVSCQELQKAEVPVSSAQEALQNSEIAPLFSESKTPLPSDEEPPSAVPSTDENSSGSIPSSTSNSSGSAASSQATSSLASKTDPSSTSQSNSSSASSVTPVSTAPQSGSTYARNLLSPDLQAVYDKAGAAIQSLTSVVDGLDVSQDDLRKVLEHYRADHPEVFWLQSSFDTTYHSVTQKVSNVTLYYTESVAQVNEMKSAMQQEAKKILSGLPSSATTYQKMLYLHDYLATNVPYDVQAKYQHTSYGAIVQNKAVCDGYSRAMQYLLGELGEECLIVFGDDKHQSVGSHAWNIVKVGPSYYHLDVTWDLPISGISHPLYVNFLVDQNTIQNRHAVFSPIAGQGKTGYDYYPMIPAASATDLNYYKQNGTYVKDLSAASLQQMDSAISASANNAKNNIQFVFATKDDLAKFAADLQSGQKEVVKYFANSLPRVSQLGMYDKENLLVFGLK